MEPRKKRANLIRWAVVSENTPTFQHRMIFFTRCNGYVCMHDIHDMHESPLSNQIHPLDWQRMHDACLPLVPSIKSNRTPLRLLLRAVSSSHRAPSPFFLLNNGCLVWVSWFLHVCFQSLFRVYHVMFFWHGFKTRQVFLEPQFFGAAFILIPQFGATQLQSLPFICLRSDPPPQKKSNKITPTPKDTQNISKNDVKNSRLFFVKR